MTADSIQGRLGRLRDRKGWTLQDLGERIDLDTAYLSRLESGIRTNPTLLTLSRLAEALGTTVSYLTGIPPEEAELLRRPRHAGPGTPKMPDRIRWARQQQGLTQSMVSRASGLTPSYLSQLEQGGRENLTLRQLHRLTNALQVSLPFLVGEMPDLASKSACEKEPAACRLFRRFVEFRDHLPAAERHSLRSCTVERRFGTVARFLLTAYPSVYTPPVLAFQLGLSLQQLTDLLQEQFYVEPATLEYITRLTAVPVLFFATGRLTSQE